MGRATLGVGDACGTALSLVSELYGRWYFGIAPRFKQNEPYYDYNLKPFGSWTVDGTELDSTKLMKSFQFKLDDEGRARARRKCVAYNFSDLSPMHLLPTGFTRIGYTVKEEKICIYWNDQSPEIVNSLYNIQTMNSVMRVATAAGLVLTHTESYAFGETHGFAHWTHAILRDIIYNFIIFIY